MKLAVIGAGSVYTPELVDGIIKAASRPFQNISEIFLHDIDKERLKIVSDFCRALTVGQSGKIAVKSGTDLSEALSGAEFTVIQIRVGKNKTRLQDEEFIRSLGLISQETTGAVGFLKAYRTIPEVLSIAEEIERSAPGTFLINFTNPAGVVSTAIHKKLKSPAMVGMCNVPVFMKKKIEEMLAANAPELLKPRKIIIPGKTRNQVYNSIPGGSIFMVWGGLNHLSWVFDVISGGISIMSEILEIITADDFDISGFYPFNKEYAKRTSTIPSPYLRFYTDTDKIIEEQKTEPPRSEVVLKIEGELLNIYKNSAGSSSVELPKKLSERGGAEYSRAAVGLINDVLSGKPSSYHIFNLPDSAKFFGDEDEFIEIPCVITKRKTYSGDVTCINHIYPDKNLIKPEIFELIGRVKKYEKAAIDAATAQDKVMAEEALQLNPLVKADKVKDILKYMK